ncbi:MAG: acetamidase/formamidase family protein [Anaerovoracaceae bacterium]
MKISSDKSVFNFSCDNKPVAKVENGAEVVIETKDCFSNQLRKPEDTMDFLDWDATNPTTGPVYVEGAKVGDILKVEIKKIVLNEKGTIVSGEGFGTLGHLLKGSHTQIIPVENGFAKFINGIEIRIKPMIGVIGVAPKSGTVNNGTPGKHGGNMDNTMVGEGATLYFNVEVDGGLFALGDLHAVMGDGEIGVSGLEIPAEVTVKLSVVKNKKVEFPMLENQGVWSVIASENTVDRAAETATECMFNFLKERMEMAEPEIVMLMSMVGNLEFCQIVDPLKTVRFVMPKQFIGDISI